MFAVFRTIKQIANADVSILVTGETGTGKEVVAKTIHEYSRRSGCPFVPFNCAAVPRELLESQLFGYKKGSFSGATDNFQGIVRAANGGTLLLDEFGEIPFDLQAKLLRFLDEREVHPIGETRPAKVDVRLIFATNMNLEEAVKQKRFREDLFYRISIVPIHIPPLRERKEEIPSLVNLFAQRFSQELAKEPIRFSDSAVELLILFSWPGNVRQLANEVRRLSVLMDSGSVVKPEHLSNHLHARSANSTSGPIVPRAGIPLDQTLSAAVELLETEMIKEALRRSGGNMSTAAASLGISRKGLYLKRLRLGPLVSNSNRRRP
jgi:transcriptional regulator with PAS, ATPase and Fis domain